MIKVIRYNKSLKLEWDNFVKKSKNGLFLFQRDFMDYHKHRFSDHSLLVYINNNLQALLPANIVGQKIISHEGLTFGGLIVENNICLKNYLIIIKNVLLYLEEIEVSKLLYKSIPLFYYSLQSQEEHFFLNIINANCFRVDTSITINQSNKLEYQKRRKRSIIKSKKIDLKIENNDNFKLFWEKILIPNLKVRFGVKPVHSLDEILHLKSKFPNNIHQINIFHENQIIAGSTIFESDNVAHSQYISSNNYGRSSGALDSLFDFMISDLFANKNYFSMGICNEENGKKINHGLLDWKEGLGGRTYTNSFYEILTSNHYLLNSFI